MILDEDLLSYNIRGFLPGPEEKEEDFLKRVSSLEELSGDPQKFFSGSSPFPTEDRVRRHHWDLKRTDLKKIFQVSPDWLFAFYHNKKLPFWQAGATWIVEDPSKNVKLALLQFRKGLKKGSYLGLYALDEILAHEAVHAVRMAYNEPIFEEHLAYLTSSSTIRRIFGSLFQKPVEFILLFLFMSGICFGIFTDSVWTEAYTLFRVSYSLLLGLISISLVRLGFRHFRFINAYKKLQKITTDPFAVLLRLTDKEILHFSKISVDEMKKTIHEEKEKSLRWRVIYLAFFQKGFSDGKAHNDR